MKIKKVKDVFMREVIDSEINTYLNDELNAFVTIKNIKKTKGKSILTCVNKKIVFVDDNYFIIEYSPIEENYNVRIFINDKGEIIQYYFDIVNKFIYKDDEIYYEDLYLDVTYNSNIITTNKKNKIKLLDQSDLYMAYLNYDISSEEYNLAYRTAYKIINELEYKKNIFYNRGLIDYYDYKNNKKLVKKH
jgi:predicted RNA-binding protein associated with RNAse of E/G family